MKETESFEDSTYMFLKTVRKEVCGSKRISVDVLYFRQSQETYSHRFTGKIQRVFRCNAQALWRFRCGAVQEAFIVFLRQNMTHQM